MEGKSIKDLYTYLEGDMLYDRYINVKFYQGEVNATNPKADRLVMSIETPSVGMKPDITLSTQALPESVCVQTTLSIKNLNMPTPTIRTWTGMVIEAGYKGRSKCIFECPLFNSYVAEPNPDGTTVFQAVAVGYTANGNFLTPRRIDLDFNSENVTIRELITKCLKTAGAEGTMSNVHLTEDTLNGVVSMHVKEGYAENGLALIEFVKRTLQAWAKSHNTRIEIVVFNRQVFINEVDDLVNLPKVMKMPTIDLRAVTSASFTGAKLEVDAPYNPNLLPGSVFYMPAQFFTGNNLPTELDRFAEKSAEKVINGVKVKLQNTGYKSHVDLYYCLIANISFSTTGSANSMHVTGIAVEHYYADGIDLDNMKGSQVDEIVQEAERQAKENKKTEPPLETITFGTPEERDTRATQLWQSGSVSKGQCKAMKLGGEAKDEYGISPRWYDLAAQAYGGGDPNAVVFEIDEDTAKKIHDAMKADYPSANPYIGHVEKVLAGDLWLALVYASYTLATNDDKALFNTELPGALTKYVPTMPVYAPNKDSLKNIKDLFKNFVELMDNWQLEYQQYDPQKMEFIYYVLGAQ